MAEWRGQWERERKALAESGIGSKRMQENMLREQRVMGALVHKLGLELFKEKHYNHNN